MSLLYIAAQSVFSSNNKNKNKIVPLLCIASLCAYMRTCFSSTSYMRRPLIFMKRFIKSTRRRVSSKLTPWYRLARR